MREPFEQVLGIKGTKEELLDLISDQDFDTMALGIVNDKLVFYIEAKIDPVLVEIIKNKDKLVEA